LYADVNNNQKYDGDFNTQRCDSVIQILPDLPLTTDCVLDTIDLSQENSRLSLGNILYVNGSQITSVNFNPPNPTVTIYNDRGASTTEISFTVLLSGFPYKKVTVSKVGLIAVE
jgi:hypothetical protein